MTQQACIISHLSLVFPHKTMFQDLQFSLEKQQVSALIGRNGQGKSLLMQLLHEPSATLPYRGKISWQTPHAYLAQLQRLTAKTIADALGVLQLHNAFERIHTSSASFEDFDLVENQWHLPALWHTQLTEAQLPTDLSFPVQHLSQGQQTKLALCALFLHSDHYLLLDEPSNHLDVEARQWLIDCLKKHPAGALVISHDQTLLNEVQHIFALNEHGLQHIKGNFEDYYRHDQLQFSALARSVDQQKRELKQLKTQQNESLMKAQKRERSGKKLQASHSQAPILLDFKKEQAGQSLGAVRKQQQKQMTELQSNLKMSQLKVEHLTAQQFAFRHRPIKTGEILRVDQLSLAFQDSIKLHFALQSGQKIQLQGANGSGKSTFLRLLQAHNEVKHPNIFLAIPPVYLDQNFSFLNDTLTVLENLKLLNPTISETEWRNQLGQLRIRGDKAIQSLSKLSGGEKLKITLLGLNYWPNNIELLLLDEPENHLDLESRDLLAHAIQSYQGAVILVSHDMSFVEKCGIHQAVSLRK